MPRKLCLDSGCAAPPTYRGYCQRHARAKEQRTNRQGKAVYNTKRWKVLRRHKLFLNPICERCTAELAVDVHHRHGVENDPWSVDGLEALCKSCHGKVTRAEMTHAR